MVKADVLSLLCVFAFYLQPANLSKYYSLRFVTSSAEKTELALKDGNCATEPNEKEEEGEEGKDEKNKGRKISASAAYEIVASAASYLQSRTNNILPFSSSSKTEDSDKNDENSSANVESSSEAASSLTNSVTSVVAAEEDVKQAVADDLKSTVSSPCDWFICDDDQSHTRFVVIQVN